MGLCASGALLQARPAASQSAASAATAPVIISPTTATTVANGSFNYQIILANGESGTYAATGLPTGLTLDAKVGAISGSTSELGVFAIQLTATNVNGTATATLTLTVEPSAPPTFTSAAVAEGVQGSAFSFQAIAGDAVTAYAANGLPAGLTIDASTGLITGTPTVVGLFTVTLQATNVRGTTSMALALTIDPLIPVVTLTADTPIANPVQGTLGSFTLTRTGDLTQPLTVTFSIKGSGENGVDYKFLPVTKTIKEGKAVKRIKVDAYTTDGVSADNKKTVKLTLQPSEAYTVGATPTAKVKIFYNP